MKATLLKDLFDYLPKSNIKAGEGQSTGTYPFYTSSETLTKYLDTYQHQGGCLVLGTGGKASVHFSPGRFSTSTDCIAIKPKGGVAIDAAYVYQYFKGNMQVLEDGFKGAGLKHISKAYLSEVRIPHPSTLNDQIRIAHLLGKVEGLIASRKQQLAQLDALLKSVFLEMFGDPILNPRGFELRKLSEFYVNPHEGTKCGPFGSALKKGELVNVGIPVWNMDNIGADGRMVLPFRMWVTEEKYEQLAAYTVQDGDILISRAGTVGKMCIARMNGQPAVLSTNLIRLRLGDSLRPLHFVSLMLYCKGRVGRLKTGPDGAFTHMNTGILDSLEFPYPPVELQDKFAAIADQIEALKSRYRQTLTDLETLYAALSQSAFKGELDLSRIPLPAAALEPTPMEDGTAISIGLDVPTSLLPDLGLTAEALANEAARLALLTAWLEAWQAHLGPRPFRLPAFLDAAQTRLQALYPESELELGMSAYEQIKDWVFAALDGGQLVQELEPASKRITLKHAHA